MTKIDYQVDNIEAGGGGGIDHVHRSEDAKLQRLGVSQQLKVCARCLGLMAMPTATDVLCRGDLA